MEASPFSQSGFPCRFAWGRQGVRTAAAQGDLLVIVDVLSFSSAVTTAVHFGGLVTPCASQAEAVETAQRIGGELAVARKDVPALGRYSLSPLTFLNLDPGTKIVLASPNGATCCRLASASAGLLVGSLLNASAVQAAVVKRVREANCGVTVVACGERWQEPNEDGDLRFAIEDYLGAGAILAGLPLAKSPEALLCENAFRQSRETLPTLLWECGSGRELRAKGYDADVLHASRYDLYDTVPVLHGEHLERWS